MGSEEGLRESDVGVRSEDGDRGWGGGPEEWEPGLGQTRAFPWGLEPGTKIENRQELRPELCVADSEGFRDDSGVVRVAGRTLGCGLFQEEGVPSGVPRWREGG